MLPPAAFVVHRLRYLLAYGSATGTELQRTGHSYLHSIVPWLVMLITLTAGCFLRSVGRAFSGHTSRARFTLSFTGLWLACAASLVAIFAGQEFLEGLFATGHPAGLAGLAGLAGIFGYGGWWAMPAAVCVGFVLAAVFPVLAGWSRTLPGVMPAAAWSPRALSRPCGVLATFCSRRPSVARRVEQPRSTGLTHVARADATHRRVRTFISAGPDVTARAERTYVCVAAVVRLAVRGSRYGA